MNIKPLLLTFVFCLIATIAISQENKILITFANKETSSIKKGDYIRLTYPTAKLELKNINKTKEFIGFRGKVDSISSNQVFLKIDKRNSKGIALNFDDILAIKKVNKSSELFTFLGTFVVIGTTAALLVNAADISPALTAFSAAFSVFPAAIITANIFYPTKPVHLLGDGYTAKIITIN